MVIVQYPPITTAEDWRESILVLDSETGDLIDLTGCSIDLGVARERGGYPLLTASTDAGSITVDDLGIFSFVFSRDTRACLGRGTYEVGITITQSGEVAQLIVGSISVIDGVVRP